ncbi:hypothetical protein GYMLUDRAFT_42427 [Collybiopsis luxurians FD-317 M1]|uniref:tripeptidyl-peptidase II n=1 Tax=Collybiopsis luxurians FD-317 M1 TaxID=944289 RepID=A0A0D0CS00_9AGAR|nr:hypothetical protein GYMLUDRAFT_42427 [Collybiopsis luxurians FD-317 M1]
MLSFVALLFFSLQVTVIFAQPFSLSALYEDLLEKHSWGTSIPSPWRYHSTPDPHTLLTLRFRLRPSNFDQLLEHLSQTSDPFHERYGQHLSKAELDELMHPAEQTVMEVREWLNWHGMEDTVISSTADKSIVLTIPVSSAETLLNATYSIYAHESDTNNQILRTLEYSLPRHLHAHISLVSPTTYFGNSRTMKKTSFLQPMRHASHTSSSYDSSVQDDCSSTITPECLRDLYNTGNYTPSRTTSAKVGIVGFLGEYANTADFATFTRRYLQDATNATFDTIEVNGGENDQNSPGTEANLDVQYAAMAWPIPMTYYSTGGSPPFVTDSHTPNNTNEPYLDWLDYALALNDDELPRTVSISYGDDEQTVPADYATQVCNMFASLGSRGVSVMLSSGDDGVGGGDCKTNNGSNTVVFQPTFPASCPYVTAVGSTTGVTPETASSFSSGGFSRLFPQPSYQSTAVSAFFSGLGSKYSGLYNKSGRAYPDVSAQGEGYQVIISGEVQSVAGTSCSSPTFASIIAYLNDFKLATNGSTLGFLNPLLYANPGVFNDIISGSNPGCNSDGFTAGVGWDPVTGLGTPDFPKLQAIV